MSWPDRTCPDLNVSGLTSRRAGIQRSKTYSHPTIEVEHTYVLRAGPDAARGEMLHWFDAIVLRIASMREHSQAARAGLGGFTIRESSAEEGAAGSYYEDEEYDVAEEELNERREC